MREHSEMSLMEMDTVMHNFSYHVMSIMDMLRWPNALAAYLEEMRTRYTDGEERVKTNRGLWPGTGTGSNIAT